MPRQARCMSHSGYMHIITRGIGRQLLFEEEQDYLHYLSALEKYCLETGVRVCAYCLMENHVHLLVHGDPAQIVLLMRKLGVNYSGWFNWKYERVGHLFQDRFKSEPVEDERYLFTVFRYILQNPVKAGICLASEYRWSSYHLFDDPPAFMELDLFREKMPDMEQYRGFIGTANEDTCLEFTEAPHNDQWAKTVLQKELGFRSGMELQNLDRVSRNAAISLLKTKGLTVRQIERLTGINRNIVQRVSCPKEQYKDQPTK